MKASRGWSIYRPSFTFIRHTKSFKQLIKLCAVWPANVWTGSRLLGVPIVIGLLALNQHWLAMSVFILFAFTDLIDGPVAQLRQEDSQNGAFFDALVDKIFILPIMWYIGIFDQAVFVPWLFWYMVGIEASGRIVVALYWRWRGWSADYYSNRWGKVKLTWQCILIGMAFFSYIINWPLDQIYCWVLWIINISATLSVILHINGPVHKTL